MDEIKYQQVAKQQQSLIKLIFDEQAGDHSFDPRGVEIYRRNLRATASQVLTITYPTVLKLIGEDLFQFACNKLLQSSPPKAGDWGLWGEGLTTF